MAVWRTQEIGFALEDDTTDHPIATVSIDTPAGRLFALAELVTMGRSLKLSGLHVHGERAGANHVGAANLLVVIQAFMEIMDVDELVVAGGVRTTGANSGQAPRLLRFTRRAADHLGG
jgi:hypothetical protein